MLQTIYAPFTQYVTKYAAYQQAYLIQKLSNVKCIKEDISDTIQALGMSIPTIFDLTRTAKKQCMDITENCGYCGLLVALRAFLLNYADQYRVAQRQLDRIKSKEEDWSAFQLCLSLMQNIGDVLINLQHLEKEMTSCVLDLYKTDTIVEYKYLLLTNSERKEIESLIKCVTEGTQLLLLDHVNTEFQKLCSDLYYTTYQVIFAPISTQLENVRYINDEKEANIHNSELPDYSFSPQEYITQVCNNVV